MADEKIQPKCMNGGGAKAAAYSSLGWMMPCCWIDPRSKITKGRNNTGWESEVFQAMFTEELKVENVDCVEDIVYSKAWQDFATALIEDPHSCPTKCWQKCSL